MLVLTRKLQQQIKIGDNITVTVLRISGTTVRIGVDAPRDVRVVRNELPPEAANEAADPLISTAETPAEKPQARIRATHSRTSSRFNMPPRKAAVSMPMIAK